MIMIAEMIVFGILFLGCTAAICTCLDGCCESIVRALKDEEGD